MKRRKRLLKSAFVQRILAAILAFYIRLVFYTSRIEPHIDPAATPFVTGDENAIFIFWHGRMMMIPPFYASRRTVHMLISLHRDGLLISQTIRHFGQQTVSGSSSRGGGLAVRRMVSLLKEGDNIGITPDGPRGPLHHVSPGILRLAMLSKKPVIPVSFAATRARTLGSWDRFMLAVPFSRIVFCVGAPIVLDQDRNHIQHESLARIEQALHAVTAQADDYIDATR